LSLVFKISFFVLGEFDLSYFFDNDKRLSPLFGKVGKTLSLFAFIFSLFER